MNRKSLTKGLETLKYHSKPLTRWAPMQLCEPIPFGSEARDEMMKSWLPTPTSGDTTIEQPLFLPGSLRAVRVPTRVTHTTTLPSLLREERRIVVRLASLEPC